MAAPQKTKKLAKKYVSKPADLNHKYYEPERLIQQWTSEGYQQEEIRNLLLKYIQDEKTKCLNDVVYFAETYGFIIGHGASGIIPFKPDDYQKELFKGQRQQKYLIVNKSRQLGVSTTTVFFSLWFSIFSSGKRTLIVANRRESAEEFITKFKTAYELLPEWLKPACTLYSKNVVEFDTKSVVRAMTSNPQAARAFSATLFVLDEAAFINDADSVVTAILPTISASDGKLFALSTPNGNSDTNWFYKTFTYAKAGLNQWKWYEFPWTVSSVFTKNINFKEEQIRLDNGNTDKFRQEYECDFNFNLDSVFRAEILREFDATSKILNKGLGGITYDDTFFVWKVAEQGEEYSIGVDCASNKAHTKDYSCFQVVNKKTHEQVAEYIGKLPTELFADILLKAARHYNNAQLVIEDNSYADALFWILEQKGYNNLWYGEDKKTPGFSTNRSSRVLLIEKLIVFYNNMGGIKNLKSPRLKVQMENFGGGKLYSNGSRKIEALTGNDDAVLAMALAVYPLSSVRYTGEILNSDNNLLTDAKNIHQAGKYSDAYIKYYADKMGVSEKSLEHKLKLYHEIRNGVYEGTALDDVQMEHPIEEYERVAAQADFLGIAVPIMTTSSDDFFELNKKGIKTIDDIFDPELGLMLTAHRSIFRY